MAGDGQAGGLMLGAIAAHYVDAPAGSGYAAEVLADSPLLYWRLGDAAGSTTAADASGNNRTGTHNGSPGLAAAGLLASDTDKAVSYDGTNDYTQIAYDAAWMAPASHTIEVLIKPGSVAAGEKAIAARHASGAASWDLILDGATLKYRFYISGWSSLNAPGLLATDTVYHVAATFDGSTRRLYVNGTEVASVASSAHDAKSAPLAIGARSNAFSGGW